MDSMPSAKTYGEGAFSCYLCHKCFDYEIKTTKGNLMDLHFQAHVVRFFHDIFGKSEVRSAFYEYHRRIIMLATFQQLG